MCLLKHIISKESQQVGRVDWEKQAGVWRLLPSTPSGADRALPLTSAGCRDFCSCPRSSQRKGVQLGGRGAAEITIVTGQKSIASNFIGRLCVTFKTRFGKEFVVKFQIGLCLCQTTCSSLVQTGLLRRGIKDKMCWLLDSIAGLSQ